MRLVCKERPLPGCRNIGENFPMLPASTTSVPVRGDLQRDRLNEARNRWLTARPTTASAEAQLSMQKLCSDNWAQLNAHRYRTYRDYEVEAHPRGSGTE